MKKYLFSLIFIVIILITILLLININDKKNNDIKEHKSIIEFDGNNAIIEDQNINGLKLTNISFTLNTLESNINLELINDTKDLMYIENIIIYIYNNKDEIIDTVYLPFYYNLKSSESVSSGLVVDCDLTNAKKVKFQIEK